MPTKFIVVIAIIYGIVLMKVFGIGSAQDVLLEGTYQQNYHKRDQPKEIIGKKHMIKKSQQK